VLLGLPAVSAHVDVGFTEEPVGLAASASLTYYFEVLEPDLESIPVEVDFFAAGKASGAQANATIQLDDFTKVHVCSGTCPPFVANTFGGMFTFSTLSNIITKISLSATAAASNFQSATAAIDPYIVIDPSTPDASRLTLILSPGIGNEPLHSGVPEPSTWAMLALGFAVLGFAGYRKAHASWRGAMRSSVA
jgi:hypothetical protein